MVEARSRIAAKNAPLDLVICIDRSGSMGYGCEGTKLDEAKRLAIELVKSLSPEDRVAAITFDSVANVNLPLTPVREIESFESDLERVAERGNTCLVGGVKASAEAFDFKAVRAKRLLILSDGRANLSFDGSGGFEGSTSLEKELREACAPFKPLGVGVITVALGSDAFIMPLKAIIDAARGRLVLSDQIDGFQLAAVLRIDFTSLPVSVKSSLLERQGLEVASFPSELPAGQPTWSLESVSEHVAVVSEEIAAAYTASNGGGAFISNPLNQRLAKVALLSVESEVLKGYCERLPKTANKVRSGKTVLLDKSYRLELELDKDGVVDLKI